jgi:mannose-1-phosphate guanylyltransferase/phosphomannomutase
LQAVILAGGKGARLLPLTKDIPKPMIVLNGKPVLEHILLALKKNNITDIIICTGHLSNIIEDHFKDGKTYGLRISYSKEEEPLGTAGPIRLIKNRLEKDFFIIYGDLVFNIDLKKMMDFHKNKKADASLVVHTTNHPQDSDIVIMNDSFEITGFTHKPNNLKTAISSAAIYIVSKNLVGHIPENKQSDFIKDVFPAALNIGKKLYGYYTEEFIKDMGTFDRIKEVEKDITKGVLHGESKGRN